MNRLNELKLARDTRIPDIKRRESEIERIPFHTSNNLSEPLSFLKASLAKAQLELHQIEEEIHKIELKKEEELENREKERFELEKRANEVSIRESEAAISISRSTRISLVVSIVLGILTIFCLGAQIWISTRQSQTYKEQLDVYKSQLELQEQQYQHTQQLEKAVELKNNTP